VTGEWFFDGLQSGGGKTGEEDEPCLRCGPGFVDDSSMQTKTGSRNNLFLQRLPAIASDVQDKRRGIGKLLGRQSEGTSMVFANTRLALACTGPGEIPKISPVLTAPIQSSGRFRPFALPNRLAAELGPKIIGQGFVSKKSVVIDSRGGHGADSLGELVLVS